MDAFWFVILCAGIGAFCFVAARVAPTVFKTNKTEDLKEKVESLAKLVCWYEANTQLCMSKIQDERGKVKELEKQLQDERGKIEEKTKESNRWHKAYNVVLENSQQKISELEKQLQGEKDRVAYLTWQNRGLKSQERLEVAYSHFLLAKKLNAEVDQERLEGERRWENKDEKIEELEKQLQDEKGKVVDTSLTESEQWHQNEKNNLYEEIGEWRKTAKELEEQLQNKDHEIEELKMQLQELEEGEIKKLEEQLEDEISNVGVLKMQLQALEQAFRWKKSEIRDYEEEVEKLEELLEDEIQGRKDEVEELKQQLQDEREAHNDISENSQQKISELEKQLQDEKDDLGVDEVYENNPFRFRAR